jgi:hypothetical protein
LEREPEVSGELSGIIGGDMAVAGIIVDQQPAWRLPLEPIPAWKLSV